MYVDAQYMIQNNVGAIINYNVLINTVLYKFHAISYIFQMVSKIQPKQLSPTFKRKKSHKQHIHNPKPKKYKHETTFEESVKAKLREEVECVYIEREKNLQQREHKVYQREHKTVQ